MTQIEDLPFDTFREELDTAIKATANKIDREWPRDFPAHPASSHILRGVVLVSENTYQALRYLIADVPKNPSRKLEFALSAPPLVRTFVDSLCAIVFLLEDLQGRPEWYLKGGWREVVEEHARYLRAYGEDPEWREYLETQARVIRDMQATWGVSEEEAANLRSMDYWPTPGQMKRYPGATQENRDFLQYLEDWFYKSLSQDTHLSWAGLNRRAAPLFLPRDDEQRDETLLKLKSDAFATAVALMLAILSEIEMELRFGLADRLRYIWGVTGPFFEMAGELYRRRYEEQL